MEYVYSALLLHSAKKEVNETNIKKVLEGVGIKADEAKTKALVAALEGVNIDEVIKQAVLPVATAVPLKEEKKAEEKEKVKPQEEEEKAEEAVSGLASLFG